MAVLITCPIPKPRASVLKPIDGRGFWTCCVIHGVQGFFEGKGQGGEGIGRAIDGEEREKVEHLGDEKGEGDHPLRLHPSHHHHRRELRAEAPALAAPQPRLNPRNPSDSRIESLGTSGSFVGASRLV